MLSKLFEIFRRPAGWRRDLLAVLAKLGVNYNSYYSRIYEFTDLSLKKNLRLNVTTQFFEPRVRFKQTTMPVQLWEIDRDLLPELGFAAAGVYRAPHWPERRSVTLYLPEALLAVFAGLEKKLTEALSQPANRGRIHRRIVEGTLTSSGRSFWIPEAPRAPVCVKIDTFDVRGVAEFLNNRRLDPGDVQLACLLTDYLRRAGLRNYFDEGRGIYIQPAAEEYRYVALERTLDFAATGVRRGDYLVPMQAVASDDFWANSANRALFGLGAQTPGGFFKEQLVREFARLIRNSVENTFLHFEIHQQNLTCHLRRGRLQKLLVHDLQDVVFDPVSYLFSPAKAGGPGTWAEKLAFIGQLYRKRFFNFYGEPRLDIAKHNHYFVPSSFYRRYFRNFGNYTRLYNKACGEDYLASRELETRLAEELGYSDAELGLTEEVTSHPDFAFLRRNPFWVIERRVEAQQRGFLRQRFKEMESGLRSLSALEVGELALRAQRESCIYSGNLPFRAEDFPAVKITAAYEAFRDQVYFLILDGGELAAAIFISAFS